MNYGIDCKLLRDLPGRIFFYPSAGQDWAEPLCELSDGIDEFRFVDIAYEFNRFPKIDLNGWILQDNSTVLNGPEISRMSRRVDDNGHEYRHIEPAWLTRRYLNPINDRQIVVTLRRGFGQHALHELPDSSLGVFWHRGDSNGNGGSNVYYLANRPRRHPPVSNLFDVLKRKLAYPALIASDGSNTRFRELRDSANQSVSAPACFVKLGLKWQEVGRLRRRTVLWLVEPI